ncbi:MAG: DUF364 domain-containing protein [Gammaproteobacteria bacterium]
MGIGAALLDAIEHMASRLALPPVAEVHVPDARPAAHRDAEFGLVALADGSAGFYYAWLGATQAGMAARYAAETFAGTSPLALARRLARDDDAERSLALAAIGALTIHLHRRAGYVPPATADSMAGVACTRGGHLGMIGNFPPLVRRARAAGMRVTVVERKTHMLCEEDGLSITLDPTALAPCSEIIATGATLINGSLDGMLEYCRHARRVVLLGPTAGVLPQVLFGHGITAVGGLEILDAPRALARLRAGEKLGDAARRYLIEAGDYPSFDALLARC